MTFSHCRSCGRQLIPGADREDGLCSQQTDPLDDCFRKFNTYAESTGFKFDFSFGSYRNGDWNALIDRWLEEGKPKQKEQT